jgi:Protein of unknown function (DUF3662)/Inner membrane component of T3SS, cytoplasmic domain
VQLVLQVPDAEPRQAAVLRGASCYTGSDDRAGVGKVNEMGLLQRFEKRLEGLVEGTFNKAFKGAVHPVEILNSMQREVDSQRRQVAGGMTLVPNRYIVELSPGDHERVAAYAAVLGREMAQSLGEYIAERDWIVFGDIVVDVFRGERLTPGTYRIIAEVHTGRDAAAGYGSGVRLVTSDGHNYPLGVGSIVIGRGEQAEIRLADVGASRRHAQLDWDGQRAVFTDLGSANGSQVNGHKVAAVTLNPGDVITIGGTRLMFRTDGIDEATRVQNTR